ELEDGAGLRRLAGAFDQDVTPVDGRVDEMSVDAGRARRGRACPACDRAQLDEETVALADALEEPRGPAASQPGATTQRGELELRLVELGLCCGELRPLLFELGEVSALVVVGRRLVHRRRARLRQELQLR